MVSLNKVRSVSKCAFHFCCISIDLLKRKIPHLSSLASLSRDYMSIYHRCTATSLILSNAAESVSYWNAASHGISQLSILRGFTVVHNPRYNVHSYIHWLLHFRASI